MINNIKNGTPVLYALKTSYLDSDGDTGGAIKIGFSQNHMKRLQDHNCSSPGSKYIMLFPWFGEDYKDLARDKRVKILKAEESKIHSKFEYLKIKGEVFKYHKDILDFIDEMNKISTIKYENFRLGAYSQLLNPCDNKYICNFITKDNINTEYKINLLYDYIFGKRKPCVDMTNDGSVQLNVTAVQGLGDKMKISMKSLPDLIEYNKAFYGV